MMKKTRFLFMALAVAALVAGCGGQSDSSTCQADSCSGHGTCNDSSGNVLCQCEQGYDGTDCSSCAAGFHDSDGSCVMDQGCMVDTCSGHGSCDDSTGALVCTCDYEYTGQRCDECADGYQDNDQDGTCNETCSTADLDCNGHGNCNDESGKAVCDCDTGYSGMECEGCSAGYHLSDQGYCVQDLTCQENSCNAHGTCDDSLGFVHCTCDVEYTGANCENCAVGYQDNDEDGTCELNCAAASPNCNHHGQCVDDSGQTECECDQGYAGADCGACASQYQDNDGNGTCEQSCAIAQLDCNEHGQCSDVTGMPECDCSDGFGGSDCSECAAGYHPDGQGGCSVDTSCQPNSCNNHGTCDDSTGEVVCTCGQEYAGTNCNECATGYQDNDHDGVCSPTCSSSGLDCGTHGLCSDSSGLATCDCDEGYSGEGCANCSTGYQDNDSNGTCLPTCVTASPDCSNHGQCSDSGGQAVCLCDEGYAGADCSGCASGYQDNDSNDSCMPSCSEAALDCSSHGTCVDTSGEAICQCYDGYAGQHCSSCATGFQDNDDDGVCMPDCNSAGLDCSNHGQCSDLSGQASCVCDEGYNGADCAGCSAGYQDNDDDGTCLPGCATAGLDCGSHGSCSDASGQPVCQCNDGYTGASCESCAVGFQDNDNDGTCQPTCTNLVLDCSDHGACDDSGGLAICVCDTAYTGEHCDQCAADYQDNDHDGICSFACSGAGLNCPTNSHCDDVTGTAECVCDEGYDGANCADCAVGYQDNDGDGICLYDCASLGWDCSNHGVCDDSTGQGICICDSGYDDDGVGHCLPNGAGNDCSSPLALDLSQSEVTGNTQGMGDDSVPGCSSGSTAEELVYVFDVSQPIHVTFETTGYDTIMYLRTTCSDPSSELACNDDGGPGLGSSITQDLDAGTYYLFVDGYGTNSGEFTLTINVDCGVGYVYDPGSGSCVDDPCDPNPCQAANQHVCDVALPGYICSCDPGYIDDPTNPGTCIVDPNPHGEACADALPLPVGEGVVSGTTSDAANDDQGSCGGVGPDRVYGFVLDQTMLASFTTSGYDTVIYLRSVCDDSSSEIDCDDESGSNHGSKIDIMLDPGSYYLWVDSWSDGGSYDLSYSFRSDPCDPDPCPGTPECVASSDWSTYECVCPEGTLPYGDTCLDDPCDPNQCTDTNKTLCVPDLPGSYHCDCNPGYIPDPNNPDTCILDPDANEWSFFVFQNADNNLESYGYEDLDEMSQAGSTEYVHIVSLFDSYAGSAKVYYITPGGRDEIADWGELDMSDWHTLRDWGIWAIQNYPARHYALIMWDHGGGWKSDQPKNPITKGFSNDDHGTAYEISISNGDYASALQGITQALGRKIDIVGFDACLMGMWEVAEASAPYANYLVASSETEPGSGWAYHGFLPGLVSNWQMSPEELGTSIVDAFYNESTSDSTLALTNLDTMGELASAMTDFANALMAHSDLYSQIDSVRSATQSFYLSEFRDIQDFAERVGAMSGVPSDLATAANALVAQLQTTITYSRAQSGYPGSNGLSIYFPSHSSSLDPAYMDSGAVWSQHSTWDDFLQSFTQ